MLSPHQAIQKPSERNESSQGDTISSHMNVLSSSQDQSLRIQELEMQLRETKDLLLSQQNSNVQLLTQLENQAQSTEQEQKQVREYVEAKKSSQSNDQVPKVAIEIQMARDQLLTQCTKQQEALDSKNQEIEHMRHLIAQSDEQLLSTQNKLQEEMNKLEKMQETNEQLNLQLQRARSELLKHMTANSDSESPLNPATIKQPSPVSQLNTLLENRCDYSTPKHMSVSAASLRKASSYSIAEMEVAETSEEESTDQEFDEFADNIEEEAPMLYVNNVRNRAEAILELETASALCANDKLMV